MGSFGRALGSSGSFVFACDHSGAPLGRRVYSVSREFSQGRLVVAGYIGVLWVHSVAHRGSRVHWGSRAFTRARPVVVVFIRVRMGSFGRALWSSGSFGFAWCHFGTPRGSRVNLGLALVHSGAPRGRRARGLPLPEKAYISRDF